MMYSGGVLTLELSAIDIAHGDSAGPPGLASRCLGKTQRERYRRRDEPGNSGKDI